MAKYRYVRLLRRGARSVYPVIIFGNMSGLYLSDEVSVRPVTSLTILCHTNQNTKFMELAVAVPIAQ